MTTATNTENTTQQAMGVRMPYDSIWQPGCYVCNWSGHLLRVPGDQMSQSWTTMPNVVGAEPLFVTRISDDPFIPLSKAKTLASNLDLPVNF